MTGRAWTETACMRMLPDGRRLHLSHGPIDLIVEAFGDPSERSQAYLQARNAFTGILPTLVQELPRLRSPSGPVPQGPVARRMHDATARFAPEFITPMAAVAGSVADFVLEKMIAGRALSRAYVNNGGDIALHLADGVFRIGVCDDPVTGAAGGIVDLRPEDGIGGIATSGWKGRSHSLGIADAVTVLAATAAQADAAATMIANQVDLPGSTKITRERASDLSPDSDLGELSVTTGVAPLSPAEIDTALHGGEQAAQIYLEDGRIAAAYIALAGDRRIVDTNQHQIITAREAACA